MRHSTVVALLLALIPVVAAGDVTHSKHNLSISGPGTIKASSETRVCVFCHVAHNSSPSGPLWNRRDPGGTYTPYTSSTLVSTPPNRPTGASILCLSCHDGTIALGDIRSASTPIAMTGANFMPPGQSQISSDMSGDHPISFEYTSTLALLRGELVDPGALTGPVKLDRSGQLQCTACHTPHDDTYGKFLVMSNQGSALCVTCHVKSSWDGSTHQLSSAGWNGVPPDPWPTTDWTTVLDNGCEGCHQPHAAPGTKRLLHAATEEEVCYACHNGHVATRDVQSSFSKPSRHPVAGTTGTHDPKETALVSVRHVECVDCHNPHATTSSGPMPFGPLAQVRGVDINGAEVKPALHEYEICFRCHADTNVTTLARPPTTPRLDPEPNLRAKMSPTMNVTGSFHPVTTPGRNPSMPGLLAPLTVGSTIACTDCHNDNSSTKAGGVGPNGPHGSDFEPLLIRNYNMSTVSGAESPAEYALCYACHDRAVLLSSQSGFPAHSLHLAAGDRCNNCHDPHGVQTASHLVNFDMNVVTGIGAAPPIYETTGTGAGSCSLVCHDHTHNPSVYP